MSEHCIISAIFFFMDNPVDVQLKFKFEAAMQSDCKHNLNALNCIPDTAENSKLSSHSREF